MTDIDRLRELTRTELRRVCEEFKSERDAAKQTATRAVGERNIAIAEATQLRDRLAAAERERDELIHDIERHIAIASREAEARIQAERERDAAYEAVARALQTHKGEQ